MTERQQVAAAAIIRGSGAETEIFTARRTEPAHLAGGWEFPGGKVDPEDVSYEEALRRELREEIGVEVDIVTSIAGDLPGCGWAMGTDYALNVFLCRIQDGKEPELLEDHDAMAWVSINDAESVAWLPVDLPPLRAAIEWVRSHPEA
ncbi:MAG: hypothetical protein RL441_1546 [Actinomycetota bacterium]|jgi:8-oxo-dGTP diphosphatase